MRYSVRGKGNRVLGGSEDTAQVCLIPTRFETLGFDADFGRLFLLQQVHGDTPQNGEVLVTGSFADAALVFPEGDVECPIAVISLDFSSTLTCPSTTRLTLAQAFTMRMASLPSRWSCDRRRALPSIATEFSTAKIGGTLALYFFALTAHFGRWVENVGRRGDCWIVDPRLLYAQVIKRYWRRRLAEVHQRVCLGSADEYRQALRALGLSGRIQTAFVERLNLTIRRSIAGLARRSWSAAHSVSELALHFDWWRARFAYHFARPHAGLRQSLGKKPSGRRRPGYRMRTPAQAAGLTDHCWTVLALLAYPVPPLYPG